MSAMASLPLTRLPASGHTNGAGDRPDETDLVDVDIVVPVYNEEAQLERSVRRLRHFLDTEFPFSASVTVADNASTDGTWAVAQRLSDELEGVRSLHLDQKGRGRALRTSWSVSTAAVVAYTDVDLSADLQALLPLVAPLLSGHSDVAIGSRLAPGARVVRGSRRELISRGYNLILRTVLRGTFSDAQCGFKALRRDVAERLLPDVRDNEWFFDTELLVLAQRNGLRIHEVPVDWTDDLDSRVDVLRTATDDLRGVWRLLRGARSAQSATPREATSAELFHFAGVGIVSTVAYLVIFLVLRPVLGGMGANAVAMTVCSVGNTAAHRRLSHGAAERIGRALWVLTGAALLIISLGVTSAALAVADAASGALWVQLLLLAVANAGAAVLRFSVLRTRVFRPTFANQGDGTARHSTTDHRGDGAVEDQ